MSRLLSKVTIGSIVAIAAVGSIYFSSMLGNETDSHNSAMADEGSRATLVSTWDKETVTDYSGVTQMTVYRSPTCGCCGAWVDHAKKHGFKIEDIQTENMEGIKQQHNVPAELASCHTTIIDGYVMEGHIPADDIKRFLSEKPENAIGLTVPAMPIGTPGMEAKDIKQPFQVLAFDSNGETTVYKEYQSY